MNYHSIPTDLPFVRQLTKSEYDSFEPFEKFSMISKQNRSLVRDWFIFKTRKIVGNQDFRL